MTPTTIVHQREAPAEPKADRSPSGAAARTESLPREAALELAARDPKLRVEYLRAALPLVPRLLSAVDRHPLHATYGCFDRQYWHYRTAAFPSEMYQEAVWPLALVFRHALPGNPWCGDALVRELAVAGMRFAARSSHRDGSCDDYYPYERALGAAVFSLVASAKAYRRLELDDAEIAAWLARRARWVARHDETGRLANHQALAALGLWQAWLVTGHDALRSAALRRLDRVLSWQSPEGWFDEYGGADPGYQTVTIDCLAQLRRLTGEAALDEPLARAVSFSRLTLHPDGTLGGPHGSRGTLHFYPHGFELLAGRSAEAADLADACLGSLGAGRQAAFDDDRMCAHRPGAWIEAYLDWSPRRPPVARRAGGVRFLPQAGFLVAETPSSYTIVSAARGGAFRRFRGEHCQRTDAGIVVQLADGRQGVTQRVDAPREIHFDDRGPCCELRVAAQVDADGRPLATPARQAALHLVMLGPGRWFRGAVRWVLQRLLIRRRGLLPVWHERRFVLEGDALRVIDSLRLLDPRVRVKSLYAATDYQAAYTAASGAVQTTTVLPWTNLSAHCEALNRDRVVQIRARL